MLKKIMTTAVVGGALFGMIAGANAEEISINVYGASAQYKFWNAASKEFFKSLGCAEADLYNSTDGDKHGITMCAGTTTPDSSITGSGINNDGNTYYFRYSSKASYDGIRSVQDLDPDGLSAGCAGTGYRQMADETNTTWVSGDATGTVNGLACKDVNVGASDVAAETFQQQSEGHELGPAGGDWISRNIYNVPTPDFDPIRPVVVPFAFFRNANESSDTVEFDNMSRLMATQIFNGQIANWNELDPDHADVQIVVCLRHAGSGTHATLDAAVMRGDYGLLQEEKNANTGEDGYSIMTKYGYAPFVYFNDGSSDEMRCVGGGTIDDYDGIGAVGYADADKATMDSTTGEYHDSSKYGDVKLMTWQGVKAKKENIVNGTYDFWSAQWLYPDPDEIDSDLISALSTFASDPDNLALIGNKADYWAAQDEMQVEKATDFTYPMRK